MDWRRRFSFLVLVTALAALSGSVRAEHDMAGEVGIDLTSFGFSSTIKETGYHFSTSRSSSAHFMKLSFSGPLVNENLANYSIRSNLFGNYFGSKSSQESKNEYVSPTLRSLYTSVTLLPQRWYPLQLYRFDDQVFPLRLEETNKGDIERAQPELGIVRRYKTQLTQYGATWRLKPNEKVNIVSEYQTGASISERVYDFGEDKDIWVSTLTSRARLGDSTFVVIFQNKLDVPISVAVINLDSIPSIDSMCQFTIDTILPGYQVNTVVYGGNTEFSFSSSKFNTFRKGMYVQTDIVFAVEYSAPAAPNDLERNTDRFTTSVNLGGEGKVKNSTLYEYTDSRELVQGQTTFLNNFANTATWEISGLSKLDMLTTYQKNRSVIENASSSRDQSMVNQTKFEMRQSRGLSYSFGHTFGHNISESFRDSLAIMESPADSTIEDTTSVPFTSTSKSTLNQLDNQFSYSIRKYDLRSNLRTSLVKLSDNSGLSSTKIVSTLTNTAETRFRGVTIRPRLELGFGNDAQKNPDKSSKEYVGKLLTTNELPSSRIFGDVTIKLEYSYRKKVDDGRSDIRSKYLLDGFLNKKFWSGWRFAFSMTQEVETFGGSAPAPGENEGQQEVSMPSVHKASYRAALDGKAGEFGGFSGSLMLITQGETKIWKYGLSFVGEIPKIKVPLKWFLDRQVRQLPGFDPATSLTVRTQFSYRFRKIVLTFEHIMTTEDQTQDKYTIHEIIAKLSRQFSLY